MPATPHLRSISPEATPEEVAAVVAALAELARRRAMTEAGGRGVGVERLDHWRGAARLSARRAGMTRGPWRLSGRLARRPRA